MFARFLSPHRIVTTFAAVFAGTLSLWSQDQTINGNLTIAGDTDLKGSVWFGRLTEDTSVKGFKVDVSQQVHYQYEEVYTPESMGTQEIWVEDGYYDTQTTTVEVNGWVNHPYWVEDVYDEMGTLINPGHNEDNYLWEFVGYDYVTNTVWVSTGGHYDQIGITIPGHYDSVLVSQSYDVPRVHFSGTRSNTVWAWRNPASDSSGTMRDLMVLSTGGLSLPSPDDTTGASRALLTHATFEQSYATPLGSGDYQSFGSKMSKNKIEVWDKTGQSVPDPNYPDGAWTVLNGKSETTLESIGMTVSYSESPDGGATMNTAKTTITASSASFGGSVEVNGPLKIAPQGDLSMGTFTHQPQN